jgi:hypothetical protein
MVKRATQQNLAKALAHYFHGTTLDTLARHDDLAASFGLPARYEMIDLVREVARHDLLSSELPLGYPALHDGRLTYYLEPGVVGREVAVSNLKRYLECNYLDLSEVTRTAPHFRSFCAILSVPPKIHAFHEKVRALGWFDRSFRSYVHDYLPTPFARQPIVDGPPEAVRRLQEVAIGARLHVVPAKILEALERICFEQLVGVSLSYKYPDDLLYPQFCLDADEECGYFGTRVDFRIGEELIEVQPPGRPEIVERTFHQHWALLEEADLGDYRIITTDDRPHHSIPTRSLADEFRALSIRDALLMLATSFRTSREQGDEVRLRAYGDYLYSAIDRANFLRGESRRAFIHDVITRAVVTPPERLVSTLHARTLRHYSPLECHFGYYGRVHRAFIAPQVALQEEPSLYFVTYFLNALEFFDPQSRDLAVLLELSDELEGRPVERTIEQHAPYPIFSLPQGRRISAHERAAQVDLVDDLDRLPSLIRFSPGHFSFAKQFIASFG